MQGENYIYTPNATAIGGWSQVEYPGEMDAAFVPIINKSIPLSYNVGIYTFGGSDSTFIQNEEVAAYGFVSKEIKGIKYKYYEEVVVGSKKYRNMISCKLKTKAGDSGGPVYYPKEGPVSPPYYPYLTTDLVGIIQGGNKTETIISSTDKMVDVFKIDIISYYDIYPNGQ